MSLRDKSDLTMTLVGLEHALHIEHTPVPTTERTIKEAIARLENTYKIKLDNGVYAAQAESNYSGEVLDQLLAYVLEGYKSLAGYLMLCMFDRRWGETLQDVEYLGFAQEQLLNALKFLQDSALYEERGAFMREFTRALDNVVMSTVKRLCIILVVAERLDLRELTAVTAAFLYAGGLR